MIEKKILELSDLKVYFEVERSIFDKLINFKKDRFVHAVDGVSFSIKNKETLGLVGESGCGKSTIAYTLIGLIKPLAGKIYLLGNNIYNYKNNKNIELLKKVQIIFQDPFSSLSPTMKIKEILERQLKISNGILLKNEISEKIITTLNSIGLNKDDLKKYPHEFSGGQKQRICIARAIITKPNLLIADEITSALDVSIQSQILVLLLNLKKSFDLSMLYITHDLRVARVITDNLAVMYLGRIVEYGNTSDIFIEPLHPYTRALITAIPRSNYKDKIYLSGNVPTNINLSLGCRLYDRCIYHKKICKTHYPELRKISNNRLVACHLFNSDE